MSKKLQITEVSTSEFRKNLSEYINRVAYGDEHILLTQHGKAIAALIPEEKFEVLTKLQTLEAKTQGHKSDVGRIGYYAEETIDPETGERTFRLKAHDPDAQRFFERMLLEGTRRRRKAQAT